MKPVTSYRDHLRAMLLLGLPLIGGHVAQFAIGLTDTIMLGWYSVEALAAVVLGGTYFFVLFILGSGFAIAVMPLVAEADAEGDETAVRRVTRMGMWLSVVTAIAAFPLFWFSGAILNGLGQNPEITDVTQGYLRLVGLGLLPALLVMVLKSYLASLGRTRVVFWVTVLAALVNAVANYALIFGHWGAPELGVIGAAIASLLVQIVSLIGVVAYVLVVLPQHKMFTRVWRPDWEAFGHVFRLGVPIGLTSLAETGLFAASSIMMGWLGTLQLAAHGIALQLTSLAFMAHLGLSNAATVRAGNAIGRKDPEHLARGARVAIFLSLAASLITVIALLAFPRPLLELFLNPNEPNREAILGIGVSLIFVAALFQFVDGAQIMALGLLRGVKDTRAPMLIGAISYWGIGVPTGYVFGFWVGWDGVGIWLGLVVGLTVAAILLLWRFWGPMLASLRVKYSA
ncbi:multidrug resistance protein, MATE family [Shimia gijangensis]|uniref:Multidrug-efflux transporter n=1 Tax=Shimia gijangensis TaxID=1470563 RepID=A0A1M6DUI0_9RHOB|nr:MATE family efflux transporter [Shimia gijangensis]SHI76927.1 multidrug resistance protein, MATE family [Shimia gijangensis]